MPEFTFTDAAVVQRLESMYQASDMQAFRAFMLDRLAAAPGERVLDVGSGPGGGRARRRERGVRGHQRRVPRAAHGMEPVAPPGRVPREERKALRRRRGALVRVSRSDGPRESLLLLAQSLRVLRPPIA